MANQGCGKLSAIIGVVSGLIAIFVFLTGKQDLSQIFNPPHTEPDRGVTVPIPLAATNTPYVIVVRDLVDTPTAYPTYTRYPTPVPTSTSVPTPTLAPTPRPTACLYSVGSIFANVYHSELGCPTNQAHTSDSAEEAFQGGLMLWRKDTDQIYVIYGDGTWQPFANTLVDGDPEYPCGTKSSPPSPRRGFAKIWCNNSMVRNKLGSATDYENGYCMSGGGPCGTFQDYASGVILQSRRFNTVYALSSDGTYRR